MEPFIFPLHSVSGKFHKDLHETFSPLGVQQGQYLDWVEIGYYILVTSEHGTGFLARGSGFEFDILLL